MRWTTSLLVGVCIALLSSLSGALLSTLAGSPLLQGASLAFLSLSLGVIASSFTARALSKNKEPSPHSTCPKGGIKGDVEGAFGWTCKWAAISLFALFTLRSFLWIGFERGDEIAFLNPNNLGDLSLHLTYIHSFAREFVFWPENPIFAGAPLHYPFGVDLFNTLLLQIGVPTLTGLVWVGLLGATATGIALWRWGGAFALAGFLCNGGFSAWRFFQTGALHDYQANVAWKSIPLALFVTQRGLLYALPVGLLLLWSWRSRILNSAKPALPLWIEILLYSTLPLFHLHTFLFLSFMLGAWMVLSLLGLADANRAWHKWVFQQSALRAALAFLPATILIFFVTGGGEARSSIHWKPGWMQGDSNPLLFWFENFGIWPLLLVALFLWLARELKKTSVPDPELRTALYLALPAVGIFLLGCFVMFAVWEWDNTKLFLWCYLVLLPPVWAMLRRTPFAARLLLCVALFFSGFLSLLGGLGLEESRANGHRLALRSELADVAAVATVLEGKASPRTAIAFYPTYNHPLLLLGYHGVAGYSGHLYSHGIDYLSRVEALEALLKGTPEWATHASHLGVQFLFWGPREEKAYGRGPLLWKEHALLLAEGEHGALYQLNGATKAPQSRSVPLE